MQAALGTAPTSGARGVYLLTTTAERYFPSFGFERIARDGRTRRVTGSVEFREACPASAVVMRKVIGVAVDGDRLVGQGSAP